jgi:hypothetical protein
MYLQVIKKHRQKMYLLMWEVSITISVGFDSGKILSIVERWGGGGMTPYARTIPCCQNYLFTLHIAVGLMTSLSLYFAAEKYKFCNRPLQTFRSKYQLEVCTKVFKFLHNENFLKTGKFLYGTFVPFFALSYIYINKSSLLNCKFKHIFIYSEAYLGIVFFSHSIW